MERDELRDDRDELRDVYELERLDRERLETREYIVFFLISMTP